MGRKRHKGSAGPKDRPASPETRTAGPRLRGLWVLLPVLLLGTLAAYSPALRGGRLWDDDRHITREDLRSWEGLRRIWFELGATQQYYPLTHSVFWFQHRLWGDGTPGYHAVNIVLHALCAFLAAAILRRLAVPGAWLAAVIFALHPVHVESVAWITELKNTLSGAFCLGAAHVYLRFDADRKGRDYALASALFLFGLLSKTVIATLPAALLVIFWWRRGALSLRRDVRPLVPWFAAGAAAGLLTAWVERTMIGAQGAEYQFTLIERGLIAGRVVWFYLGKLFWPAGLIFIYPRWEVNRADLPQYLYPLALAALLAVLWMWRKRSRAPLAAMLIFCGTLFPVMGFFNVYPFRYSFVADHFQYLPSLAVIALIAAGLAGLARRVRSHPQAAAAAITLLAGGALAIRTYGQSRQYGDAVALYRATLDGNPSCWMAYNNLGNVFQGTGRSEEALEQYRQALRLKPDFAEAYNNMGGILEKLGRREDAVAAYRQAVRLMPDLAGAWCNLGNALSALGRRAEAAAQYREALKRDPNMAAAHCNLGAALSDLGRTEEAAAHLEEALRLQPDYAAARMNYGIVLQRLGKLPEAVAQLREAARLEPESPEYHNVLGNAYLSLRDFDAASKQILEALRLKPEYPEALSNLGNVLLGAGRIDEAVTRYREALRLNPDHAGIHFNLGNALQTAGRLDEAASQYREALSLKPDFAEAHYNLALILQDRGRPAEALPHFREMLRLAPGSAEVHNTMGVALAQLGRIDEAASEFRESLRLKPDFAEARNNLNRALAMLRK